MKKLLLLTLILTILALPVLAQNQVVANSEDWTDVFSSINYASINDAESFFLISKEHGQLLPNRLGDGKVLVVESKNDPFIVNYQRSLENQGFEVEELSSGVDNINLDLAEKSNAQNFIIIDPSYGYNAISVGPYAALTKAFVIFAEEDNIDDVYDLLTDVEVKDILLYGTIDREVKDQLQEFNPEVINNGNRFDDNVEIVKKFKSQKEAKQILFTNGEFIENEIATGGKGTEPVLFVGKDQVPKEVLDYVKKSDIEVGILVGNDLTTTSKILKDAANINVMIKFGQSGAVRESAFQQVEGLDTFPLPKYTTRVTIADVEYNTADKTLNVIYKNEEETAAHAFTTVEVTADGDKILTTGDEEPIFIDGEDIAAVSYKAELSEFLDTELIASLYTQFGEDVGSLENVVEEIHEISITNRQDECEIKISDVAFNTKTHRFEITIKNLAETTCFADPQLKNLIINDEKTSISYDGSLKLSSNKESVALIKQRMDEVDMLDNEEVTVKIFYGEREDFLVKSLTEQHELRFTSSSNMKMYVAVGVVVIIVLLFFFKKKKNKQHQQ